MSEDNQVYLTVEATADAVVTKAADIARMGEEAAIAAAHAAQNKE